MNAVMFIMYLLSKKTFSHITDRAVRFAACGSCYTQIVEGVHCVECVWLAPSCCAAGVTNTPEAVPHHLVTITTREVCICVNGRSLAGLMVQRRMFISVKLRFIVF